MKKEIKADVSIAVSVLIPVYNTAKYLPMCLDSVLAQTLENIEIICVNDGSSDNSGDILRDYAKRDKRIVIVEKENGGLPSARNAGLDIANGEYLAFLDSDDFLKPNALQVVYDKAKRKKADVVVFGSQIISSNGNVSSWLKYVLSPRDCFYKKFSPEALFCECGARPFLWRDLVKRDLIESHYLRLDPEIVVGEDQAFQFQFFPYANRILFCSDKLYCYRCDREDSIMFATQNNVFQKVNQHLLLVERVFEMAKKNGFFDQMKSYFFEWGTELLFGDIIKLSSSERKIIVQKTLTIFREYDITSEEIFLSEATREKLDYFQSVVSVKTFIPEVSIIVDASNTDFRLDSLHNSLQSLPKSLLYEIIFVNDGCKEYEHFRLHRYVLSDLRARLFNFDKKIGRGALFNTGVSAAEGQRLLFLTTHAILSSPGNLLPYILSDANWSVLDKIGRFNNPEFFSLGSFVVKKEFLTNNNISFRGSGKITTILFYLEASELCQPTFMDKPFCFMPETDPYAGLQFGIVCYKDAILLAQKHGLKPLCEKLIADIYGEPFAKAVWDTAWALDEHPRNDVDFLNAMIELSSTVSGIVNRSNGTALLPAFKTFVDGRKMFLNSLDE